MHRIDLSMVPRSNACVRDRIIDPYGLGSSVAVHSSPVWRFVGARVVCAVSTARMRLRTRDRIISRASSGLAGPNRCARGLECTQSRLVTKSPSVLTGQSRTRVRTDQRPLLLTDEESAATADAAAKRPEMLFQPLPDFSSITDRARETACHVFHRQ
jgi:hypothetical protein